MMIRPWPLQPSAISQDLERQGTVYRGERYSGLISTASVELSADTAHELEIEMRAVWEWNRSWHDIYSEHLAAGDREHWLVQATEWGLPAKALSVQRMPEVLMRDPRVGRIDSVDLDPMQQIAEVQWKGGGEGFAAGVQATYLRMCPPGSRERPLGSRLVEAWGELFRRAARGDVAFVVNSSRDTWSPSERFLTDELRDWGVELMFVPRSDVGARVRIEGGRVMALFGSGWQAVDFLYLDRVSEALPTELFHGLIKAYLSGEVHLEPPPTYIYSQKLGYVLPFHDEYRSRFSDGVREILIPSVLVDTATPNLLAIVPRIEHDKRELLAEVRSWEDLQRLPVGLRRQLVVKCGSVNGRLNNAGRGVWRLGAKATLEAVLERVRGRGEPWIVQPYVNRTWQVPLAPPDQSDDSETSTAHARFCVYCEQDGDTHRLLGGLATFSTFWKAAGKDVQKSTNGRIGGSAFVDIRVAEARRTDAPIVDRDGVGGQPAGCASAEGQDEPREVS